MPLTPNNREEHWLQGMVDGETTLTPNKRREYWYKEIIDAQSGGGGGGGALVLHENESGTLNKTWQEIYDAMKTGSVVIEVEDDGIYPLASATIDGKYYVTAPCGEYVSDTTTGYPTYIG